MTVRELFTSNGWEGNCPTFDVCAHTQVTGEKTTIHIHRVAETKYGITIFLESITRHLFK